MLLAGSIGVLSCSSQAAQRTQLEPSFASRIAQLSEPAGYFDTDNLISNEASYLHVMGKMRELGVTGGAYIGVGPDQNFSYIAQIRPSIAFIIDIRRDNMLEQLLFKALFALARNRAEYLSLLFGRPPPGTLDEWTNRGIAELLAYIDSTPTRPETIASARRAVDRTVAAFDVPLSVEDWATIDRYHQTFIREGLSLKFRSFRRPPRFYYPTFRELLMERDLTGRHTNYLASEGAFRVVKSLQDRDLVIPVVGDLAGTHALKAIGQLIAARRERVSALYTSNVEFYLFRSGGFGQFLRNVEHLPRDERSVIIRSVFRATFGPHPLSVPGYYSTQLLQTLETLVEEAADGGYRSYWELVTKHALR
ncbi:MAG: hypothetical protein GTN62_09790 [Gemmatimonadales bacterium]|nr:hypothetical protein [Gemmatimonadales bacterium]NIN11836.1 hypothetical protein [Gemmatimonadales bacterium]NIN50386.1 hypothetical protein [Gemmatimonadales bacterium]NIP07850.1 hypothetical protein [Gemmatimonadales bacterium]NIR02055.1 hypothetical protein [Gemmatimonadales bacterium]